jgi:Response regulator containing a CheY-like receiver domain and a GGDEF domain
VNEQTKLRALNLGATDFLNKPLDHIEVLLRIRNMLETRRIHQLLEKSPRRTGERHRSARSGTSRRASRAR